MNNRPRRVERLKIKSGEIVIGADGELYPRELWDDWYEQYVSSIGGDHMVGGN